MAFSLLIGCKGREERKNGREKKESAGQRGFLICGSFIIQEEKSVVLPCSTIHEHIPDLRSSFFLLLFFPAILYSTHYSNVEKVKALLLLLSRLAERNRFIDVCGILVRPHHRVHVPKFIDKTSTHCLTSFNHI